MSAFDEGLLSPVTVGIDDLVGDAAVVDALVAAERALIAAYAEIGLLTEHDHADLASSLGAGAISVAVVTAAELATASVSAGNPVIALVARLRDRAPEGLRSWVHRGATSQDIVDSALMIVAKAAVKHLRDSLSATASAVRTLAEAHADDVVAARTLTQHAVPTTVGIRFSGWVAALDRAAARLSALELPAQLAGAAGTRASFVEITGSASGADALVAAFSRHVGLQAPTGSWQVTRWPVTELGDALVQTLDAVGKLAADVTTLSRTEIGELAEGAGGASSAMPQKRNPVESTLIRSAAIRAPQLGATLHLTAALAVDERPDGAWHAEWPTLRELLRLALGSSAHAASLAANLRVDRTAAARNLALAGGLIVSERLALVLVPLIGRAAFDEIIRAASDGAELRELLARFPETADLDIDALLDPSRYIGRDPQEREG